MSPTTVTRALLWFSCFLGSTGAWGQDAQNDTAERPAAFRARKGVIIEFRSEINPLTQQYLYRQLAKAEQLQADLVVIEIDSPGGTLVESEEIADKLRRAQLRPSHRVYSPAGTEWSGYFLARL